MWKLRGQSAQGMRWARIHEANGRVAEATELGLTLARYRLMTLEVHFLPSFSETLDQMREALGAIEAALED